MVLPAWPSCSDVCTVHMTDGMVQPLCQAGLYNFEFPFLPCAIKFKRIAELVHGTTIHLSNTENDLVSWPVDAFMSAPGSLFLPFIPSYGQAPIVATSVLSI